MATPCEEIIKKVVMGLVFLYLVGFLLLYYAIRKLLCLSVSCGNYPGHLYFMNPLYGLDTAVTIFVLGSVLITVLLYLSSQSPESKKTENT